MLMNFEIIAAPDGDLRMLQQRGLSPAQWQDREQGLGGWVRLGGGAGGVTEAGSYGMVAPVFACVRARADALGMWPITPAMFCVWALIFSSTAGSSMRNGSALSWPVASRQNNKSAATLNHYL